jgi:hypothetical protein
VSEPLDFSNVGAKKGAPAPPASRRSKAPKAPKGPKAPKEPKTPRGPGPSTAMKVLAVVAVVAVAAVVAFVVLGGDDEEGGATSDAAGLARYCDLSTQLDGLVVTPGGASPEVSRESFHRLAGMAEEMRTLAPAETRDDVAAVVESLERAATGDEAGVTGAEYQEQRSRLTAFRGTNCGVGSGSGDG